MSTDRVVFLSILVLFAVAFAQDIPSVVLPYGTVYGNLNPDTGVQRFLGLNYAQPLTPRFTEGKEIDESSGNPSIQIDARYEGKSCPSQDGLDPSVVSEDCLNLNIARPSGSATGLPVIVWIYGGAFVGGTTRYFDPSTVVYYSGLLGTPVIHVAMNYRLSGWGFLASNETAQRGALNLGLKDQRLALKWVKKYISLFGGDPNKITVYGESAGAISIAYHLTAYGATKETDLFRSAILQSGSSSTVRVPPARYWQPVYDQLVSKVGCSGAADTFSCLQNAPYDTIASVMYTLSPPEPAIGHFNYGPTLDFDLIPDAPYRLIQQGKYNKVPLILGDNLDEGTTFTNWATWNTDQDVKNQIKASFPDLTDNDLNTLLQLYPNILSLGSPYNTGNRTYRSPQFKRGSSIIGDISFVAPRRFLQDTYAAAGVPTWSYRYDYNFKLDQIDSDSFLGVTHGDEVGSVYAVVNIQMTRDLVGYWITFANNLNPNFGGAPAWNQFDITNLAQIRFEQDSTVLRADDFRREQSTLINSLVNKLFPFNNGVPSSDAPELNSFILPQGTIGVSMYANGDCTGQSTVTIDYSGHCFFNNDAYARITLVPGGRVFYEVFAFTDPTCCNGSVYSQYFQGNVCAGGILPVTPGNRVDFNPNTDTVSYVYSDGNCQNIDQIKIERQSGNFQCSSSPGTAQAPTGLTCVGAIDVAGRSRQDSSCQNVYLGSVPSSQSCGGETTPAPLPKRFTVPQGAIGVSIYSNGDCTGSSTVFVDFSGHCFFNNDAYTRITLVGDGRVFYEVFALSDTTCCNGAVYSQYFQGDVCAPGGILPVTPGNYVDFDSHVDAVQYIFTDNNCQNIDQIAIYRGVGSWDCGSSYPAPGVPPTGLNCESKGDGASRFKMDSSCQNIVLDVVPAPQSCPTTSVPTIAPTTSSPTTTSPTTVELTTTNAPTTVEPTTAPTTTIEPTTKAPTTTVKPTTIAPTTIRPTTAPSTTIRPTTKAPTTVAPTTKPPTCSVNIIQKLTSSWVENQNKQAVQYNVVLQNPGITNANPVYLSLSASDAARIRYNELWGLTQQSVKSDGTVIYILPDYQTRWNGGVAARGSYSFGYNAWGSILNFKIVSYTC